MKVLGIDPGSDKTAMVVLEFMDTAQKGHGRLSIETQGFVRPQHGIVAEFVDFMFDVAVVETVARRFVRPGQAMHLAATAQNAGVVVGQLNVLAMHESVPGLLYAIPAFAWKAGLGLRQNAKDVETRRVVGGILERLGCVDRPRNVHFWDASAAALFGAHLAIHLACDGVDFSGEGLVYNYGDVFLNRIRKSGKCWCEGMTNDG